MYNVIFVELIIPLLIIIIIIFKLTFDLHLPIQ